MAHSTQVAPASWTMSLRHHWPCGYNRDGSPRVSEENGPAILVSGNVLPMMAWISTMEGRFRSRRIQPDVGCRSRRIELLRQSIIHQL